MAYFKILELHSSSSTTYVVLVWLKSTSNLGTVTSPHAHTDSNSPDVVSISIKTRWKFLANRTIVNTRLPSRPGHLRTVQVSDAIQVPCGPHPPATQSPPFISIMGQIRLHWAGDNPTISISTLGDLYVYTYRMGNETNNVGR
jgi:hypothetical protein